VANDFSDSAGCKALWNFESGALTTDSKGGNTLVNSGVSADADEKQGDWSGLWVRDSADYMYVLDDNLDSGVPLKYGESNKSLSYSFWIKLTRVGSVVQYILHKGDTGLNSINVQVSSPGTIGLLLSANGTSWGWGGYHGSALVINRWYHVTVTYDGDNDDAYRIRIWDDTAQAIHGVDKTGTASDVFIGNASIWLGYPVTAYNLDARVDEFTIWDRALNVAETDAIRSGEYTGPIKLGTASGSIEFTGTANGKINKLGTASGSCEFVGTVVAHNYNLATASGASEFTASAIGKVLKKCTASGSVEFTGTALAHNYQLATASGLIEFVGTATALSLCSGTASGSIEFVGTAIAHNYNLGAATGAIEFTGVATGKVLKKCTASGSIEFTGIAIARNIILATATGSVEFTASAIAHNYQLATATGAITFIATAIAHNYCLATASGSFEFVGTAEGENYNLALCVGSIEFTAAATGKVLKTFTAEGSCEFTGTAKGVLGWAEMPPEMHAALIDPFSGGAWLWLVEIKIPGYDVIRLARNPVNINYAAATYTKNNFNPGLAALTGDGSIPRTMLQVAQDADYTLEDKINATQGAGGGWIKLIRAHEDFLDKFIVELEQDMNILTAESDTEYVIFQLGIPDPLLKKIPLRRYSSKKCPWALPSLFKGEECQYAGVDVTCGGTFEDCCDKNNEAHWGGEIALDPSVTRV